jgi:hypothetical protein
MVRKGRALARCLTIGCASGIEPEMHDVAVGDDVFLALEPQLAGVAGAGLTAERYIPDLDMQPQ